MRKTDLNKIIMQNILHHADIGVHVIDNKRKTVVYNEFMARLEGLDKNQVLEKDILEIFPSLNEETSTLIKVLHTGEGILNSTQSYFNFKGQRITTINSTIPLYDNDEIIGALEIANNITHIKNLSDQLIELQNKLNLTQVDKKDFKSQIKRYNFHDIIGNHKSLEVAKKIAKKAKDSGSSVLIYGDTGTGKELFAQSIHYGGIRRKKAFIAQNCAAIPEALLEGILFGTDKGGFTGATEREGIFEQAHGGTLMLDEINSMSLSLQAKILRVLQEGYIRRVGGKKDIPVDVRIIATTNEDPLESLKNGTIRKDLYYRLNVIFIKIPSLAERRDDIIILSEHFVRKYNLLFEKNIKKISKEVLEQFMKYTWPGNVRELGNVIEGAMNIVSDKETILKQEDFISSIYIMEDKPLKKAIVVEEKNKSLPDILEEMEKDIILNALERNENNITRTAKELGIKRQTLQHKLKKYIV
ncbi:sigma 54-interacting transcriptional regulator [Tissierella pigra]|uniref:AAA domain-containing protein n=1 Tax=Tissierella pigra TaxID=2607614 RepID=A0A6N7XU97_9FIRM|nr:sigma 54-interacting transcriptional regulator [Tissierella pigra]MBU5426779.1 sigma 54-interacting transcriptional regulator [Tissierella pigra]MSU01347.1 AAA domain-containing protein [Tissierella pigra]